MQRTLLETISGISDDDQRRQVRAAAEILISKVNQYTRYLDESDDGEEANDANDPAPTSSTRGSTNGGSD